MKTGRDNGWSWVDGHRQYNKCAVCIVVQYSIRQQTVNRTLHLNFLHAIGWWQRWNCLPFAKSHLNIAHVACSSYNDNTNIMFTWISRVATTKKTVGDCERDGELQLRICAGHKTLNSNFNRCKSTMRHGRDHLVYCVINMRFVRLSRTEPMRCVLIMVFRTYVGVTT